MTSRCFPALVRAPALGAIAAMLLAGCAAQAASSTPRAVTVQAHTTSKAAWANEGARLRQYKHAQNLKHKPTDFPGGQLPGNSGDWAFQSLPIDIGAAGKYTLTIPVASWFDYPTSPYGFSFDTPPDATFRVMPSGAPTVHVDHGQKYLMVPVTASGRVSPYRGYTAWIW